VYFSYSFRHSRLRNPHLAAQPIPGRNFNPEQQLPESDLKDKN